MAQPVTSVAPLDYESAADYCNLSVRTIKRAVAAGSLAHIRIGSRHVRFLVEDLDRWLDQHRRPGRAS